MKAPAISVRNLTNRFADQLVHDGLSFDIPRGEIVGLVGGSGSGKSVLMRSIIGLHQPTEGEVKIFGRTQAKPGEIGVLFQHGALFSGLSVERNIMVPLREHTGLPLETCREIARMKIALTGLAPETALKFPSQLSGGMIKRAALARALALDASLLFLDEPTAGLDPIAAADFDTLIRELQQGLGITVVIITHDLDTLFSICTRIAVLVDKKIVTGTLDDMLRSDHPWIRDYFHGPRARAALPRENA